MAKKRKAVVEYPPNENVVQEREQAKQRFIDYLKSTLIPDLIESGHTATAEDFRTCLDLIEDKCVDGFTVDVVQPKTVADVLYAGSVHSMLDTVVQKWGLTYTLAALGRLMCEAEGLGNGHYVGKILLELAKIEG